MTEATQLNVSSSKAPPEAPDLTGRTLGDYQVLRRLGRGGMGEVYLAEQRSLKRKVALKILRGDLASNPTSLKRFQQEAEAVAKATHANIVQVYACDQVDGIAYMALEYVEGRNLKEYFTKKGPPELPLAISLMRQIAAALQRASELGIIHRDIKPENILLTRKGEVKVADFGLSRVLAGEQPAVNLTQSGITMGTPLYMSPEQVEGKPVDPRTDIYSFGVTCYHMMAGEPPFTGKTAFEVALAHVRTEPEPLQDIRPDLPEAFCAVIHKMMAKEPADRYQTCRELMKDLARVRDTINDQTTTLKSDELGIELMPLDELTEASASAPSEPTMREPRPPSLWRRHGRLLLLLFALGTLIPALFAGATLAWAINRLWTDKGANHSSTIERPPSDSEVDAILNAQKHEEALRVLADKYLADPQAAASSPAVGFGVCKELGLIYLKQDKLDEADKLFKQLEKLDKLESYRLLGQVGHAIVLALQNKPAESNKLFKDAFEKRTFEAIPKGGAKKFPLQMQQFFQDAQVRYWLAEAIHYNEHGGVTLKDMSPNLVRFRDPTIPLKP